MAPGEVVSHALDVADHIRLATQLLSEISRLQLQTLQVVELFLDLMAWQYAGQQSKTYILQIK